MQSQLPLEVENRALALAGECRTILREMLGPPRLQFQAFSIRQSSDGPTIAINGNSATLVVGPNALCCESNLVSNIAHESLHLHVTNGALGNASGLEEGLALHFELSMVEQHFGNAVRDMHIDHLSATYAIAFRDYEQLRAIVDNPAMRALEKHGKLTGLSWGDVRQLFPETSWLMSYRLVRRRRMRG